MKLMLDGKEIGSYDPQTAEVRDASGNAVTGEPAPGQPVQVQDKMNVPLDHPLLQPKRERQRFVETRQGKTEPAVQETVTVEPAEAKTEVFSQDALERKLLTKQNEALTQQVASLLTKVGNNGANLPESIDIKDLIPDDIDPENDPMGVARTLKGMVSQLKQQGAAISRLDQHTGFSEFNKTLDAEKSDFKEIFEDKDLGPIAGKLLDAELKLNATEPIASIVANVVKSVSGLKAGRRAEQIQDKVQSTKSAPRVLRGTEGAPAAITVDRPRNVKEAGEAYRSWKAAKQRHSRGQV